MQGFGGLEVCKSELECVCMNQSAGLVFDYLCVKSV